MVLLYRKINIRPGTGGSGNGILNTFVSTIQAFKHPNPLYMEYRSLGNSGLRVPVLSFGTATFGGTTDFFRAWGTTQLAEAKSLIDICLEHGLHFFDTANTYSSGVSEQILGNAVKGRRQELMISTKATFRMGSGPNDYGSGRSHLVRNCEQSLKRLDTDYIDLYYMHGFDATTPVEETLRALEHLLSSGKIRYIGCSNFSGWHLMKSLSVSERYGWSKYIAHQAYYSLLNREFEWELMPLGLDQGVGTVVWSPLSGGQLSGKIKRNEAVSENSRYAQQGSHGPAADPERLYSIVDKLIEIAAQRGKTVAQVALNWLLQRPGISSIVIGARSREQLLQNLGSVGWQLTRDEIEQLDAISEVAPIYPYWHQNKNSEFRTAVNLYQHLNQSGT
jgi:aryl-alcohol dehydrogenase-like predicted oxidoreductase